MKTQESIPTGEWSMVVPRMRRCPRPSANPAPHPAARLTAETLSGSPPSHAHLRFSCGYASDYRVADPWRAVRFILTLVVAVVAISFWAAARIGSQFTSTPVSFATPSGEDWVYPQASARARDKSVGEQLLYIPSAATSDFRMEFNWRMQAGGVGCVFRAKDPQNYYVARLKLVPGGIEAEHFSVIDRAEGEHFRSKFRLPRREPELGVTIEAIGPIFTLYVQDELIDTWRDEKLSAGAVGFIEPRKGRVPAQAIRLTLLNATRRESRESILQSVFQGAQRWWESMRVVL